MFKEILAGIGEDVFTICFGASVKYRFEITP